MVTKKRATPKIAEAAPTYTPRSRVRPSKSSGKTGAQGEALWDMLQTLPEEEQSAFAKKMMNDPEWYEDLYDSISIIQAKKETGRPYSEFREELKREGLL